MPRTTECLQCGAATEWNEQVGSSVCISCGSLVDPSQSVLTSVVFNTYDSTEFSVLDVSTAAPLKSLRSGNNWDLAGQGKEARDKRNSFAIVEFIKSLAVCFNAPGLSPRAISLFNQAKSTSNFSWGRKAKLVAGACLAIALRESNRPDALIDISNLLSLPQKSVAREFIAVTSMLGLSLTLLDPSAHMPNLQSHLSAEVLASLPPNLARSLETLCLRAVADTAVELSRIIPRLSPDHDVLRLPVPATACGIFILALEAENRGPLNPLTDLAQCLGNRYQVAKSVVMTRYKTLQDEAASWVEDVPWLDKFRPKQGRAKISKRLVVARGLKDVIKFQDDIWQRRSKPVLNLELTEEERLADQGGIDIVPSPIRDSIHSKTPKALVRAQNFLMDPINAPVPSACTSPRSAQPEASISLATYLLTNPTAVRLPTRLQLLATLRGGSSEAQISDDELFSEGEFDKLFRSEDEVNVLRNIFGWSEGDVQSNGENVESSTTSSRPKVKRKRPDASVEDQDDVEALGILSGSALRPRKKSRLNVEAFAQFMAEEEVASVIPQGLDALGMIGLAEAVNAMDEDGSESGDDDENEGGPTFDSFQPPTPSSRSRVESHIHSSIERMLAKRTSNTDQGEVILDNWRPPSPGCGVPFNDSRYEEEYD